MSFGELIVSSRFTKDLASVIPLPDVTRQPHQHVIFITAKTGQGLFYKPSCVLPSGFKPDHAGIGGLVVARIGTHRLTQEFLVTFDIEGSSFLPHQVRNTVGALIRVGQGKINSDEFSRILDAKKIGLAGPTVPACGLCLTKVNYLHNFGEEK